jgi:hypothetical protein
VRLPRVLAALALVLAAYGATPLPVAACDCTAAQPMAAYAGRTEWTIFSGRVQAPDPAGVLPVLVSRWFQGDGAAGLVWIDGSWGAGGASCEVPLPPVGSEWIFVAWRRETGELDVNLCTPHAEVGTDVGGAMLTDAFATFGDGGAGPPAEPSAPPALVTQGAGGAELLPLVSIVAALAAAVVVVGAALTLLRRRGPA